MSRRYDITIKLRERGPEAKPECTVEIEAAYCEQFVKNLKDAVHYTLRHFDPDTKCWYVRACDYQKVVSIARACDFDEIIVVEGTRTNYLRRDTTQPSIFDKELT